MNNVDSATARHRILLVDDHSMVRFGLRLLLGQETDLTVCGEADSQEAASAAIHRLKPDLVVLDLWLNGEGGLEMIKALRSRYRDLPILVVSESDEATYRGPAVEAGAQGYLMKQAPPDTLLAAIRTALTGKVFLGQSLLESAIAN